MLGVLRNQHGTWVLEKENDLLLGHNNEIPNGFQNVVTEVCTDVYLKSNLNVLINIVI